MTHLGQRLSALIDGELEGGERQRVLLHVTRCDSCRAEVVALRTLKRKVGALGEAAAGAGLTGRLMGLGARGSMADSEPPDGPPPPLPPWPDRSADERGRGQGGNNPLPSWPDGPDSPQSRGQGSAEQRTGRYFLAGSVAVFLAGLGTAAFIAGGEPQPQAPTLPVTPSVDVMVFPHGPSGDMATSPPIVTPSSVYQGPTFTSPHPSHTRT